MNRRNLLLVVTALVLLLCAWSTRSITGAPIESDAAANLRMSINLAHHGTISEARVPPVYAPSMYREPLPVRVRRWGLPVPERRGRGLRDRDGLLPASPRLPVRAPSRCAPTRAHTRLPLRRRSTVAAPN